MLRKGMPGSFYGNCGNDQRVDTEVHPYSVLSLEWVAMDYVVVIERAADGSYSAYVPDLPGCVARGDTADEVRRLISEAVTLHIESLRRHGEPVPPAAIAGVVAGGD